MNNISDLFDARFGFKVESYDRDLLFVRLQAVVRQLRIVRFCLSISQQARLRPERDFFDRGIHVRQCLNPLIFKRQILSRVCAII